MVEVIECEMLVEGYGLATSETEVIDKDHLPLAFRRVKSLGLYPAPDNAANGDTGEVRATRHFVSCCIVDKSEIPVG